MRWSQHVVDQRSIPQVRQVAWAVEAKFGGVDIVFANAGIQAFKPVLEMNDADLRDQIDVNLLGTGNVVRAPALVRRAGGRMISGDGDDGSMVHPMSGCSFYLT